MEKKGREQRGRKNNEKKKEKSCVLGQGKRYPKVESHWFHSSKKKKIKKN